MRLVRTLVRIVVRVAAVLVVLAVLAVAVAAVVPFTSTGTLTHREAAEEYVSADSDESFLEVLGIELHVERPLPATSDGTGPTAGAGQDAGPGGDAGAPLIVLLHGFGASTATWREIAPGLTDLGEVVAYDRPAFGFTERVLDADLDAFVAREGVDPYGANGQVVLLDALLDELLADGPAGTDAPARPVILVGHSAGGTLAAEYALAHPERVTGVVLVAPAILTTGGTPRWLQPVLALPPFERAGPWFARLAARGSGSLLERSWHDPARVTDAMRARYAEPESVRDWERGLWALVAAPGRYEVGSQAGTLAVPVLLVTGDDDRVVPTADTRTLAALIDGSELVVLDAVGHIPQEEDPEGTLAAVRTFVAGLRSVA